MGGFDPNNMGGFNPSMGAGQNGGGDNVKGAEDADYEVVDDQK
jgi:hypothetical protein